MRGVRTCKASSESIIPAARLAACAVTRQMPRLISKRFTGRLRPARQLTFVVPLCRAATHPDKQALHRQRPEGQSRRTASRTKFLPRLRNGARGNRSVLTCTTPSRSRGLRAANQITVWPDYFVDDRDYSSCGQF